MPYTIDPSSADCYPCTSVLINKFDLRSQQELDRVEAVLVTAKAAQWEESPLCSTFDFEHYKAIHRHLFCDLYEWAGVPRSINISKKGTQFCPADDPCGALFLCVYALRPARPLPALFSLRTRSF